MEEKQEDVNVQESVQPEKTQTSDSPSQSPIKSQSQDVGSKEYNWRQMEEKHKKEIEQLQRELWELKQKKEESTPQEEELKLQEDDLITYGQLDKLAEKKARAIFQEELKKVERAKQPLAAKQKYPDFEQVVTSENIEKLKQEDPELEKLIMLSDNPFERTYREIKRADFFKSQMKNKESDEKIAENMQKPVSSSSLGKQRPLSLANDYAKGSAELYAEMRRYSRGVSSI